MHIGEKVRVFREKAPILGLVGKIIDIDGSYYARLKFDDKSIRQIEEYNLGNKFKYVISPWVLLENLEKCDKGLKIE